MKDKRSNPTMAKAGAYMGLAMVIPAAMYAGHWIGGHADRQMGTEYWAIVGLMVGFALGLVQVMREATRIEKIGKNR